MNRYCNASQLHLVVISVRSCNPVPAKEVLCSITLTSRFRVRVRREVTTFPCVFKIIEEVVVILWCGLSTLVLEVPVEIFPHVFLIFRELERRAHSAIRASSVRIGRSVRHRFVKLLTK